eukprot:3212601-Rhodomonas_salina.4
MGTPLPASLLPRNPAQHSPDAPAPKVKFRAMPTAPRAVAASVWLLGVFSRVALASDASSILPLSVLPAHHDSFHAGSPQLAPPGELV